MLTATLQGLVDRFNLHGERLGDVVGGAVMKHSRDFNLVRESVLSTTLSRDTPAFDIQQACGTGLEAAMLVANKIALGHIECGIAGGVDTTSDAPDRAEREAAQDPAGGQPRQDHPSAWPHWPRCARHAGQAGPATQRRAAHRLFHGRACRADGRRMGHSPRRPGRTGAQEPPEPGARL
jgi:acetyl-CoA acetyltransferase